MAKDTFYSSGQKPKSSILKSTFVNRLSSLFGYKPVGDTPKTEIGKRYGIEFVKVDLNSPGYRFKNAALGNLFESHNLSEKLERLFDAYMEETTLTYNDIQDRQKRLNELSYLYYNDPFCARVVELVGDEATQLDVQNRLISVESPNLNFSARVYELLQLWGVTQQRIQGLCRDLELYGEGFWTHKIGLNGIEKIIPIRPNSIMERLEFSPVHMSEYLAQRDGWAYANRNRSQKIDNLIEILKKGTSMEYAENLADYFDNKLLGYEIEGDMIVPPWCITHFRFNAENSEFYPYGRPPLINCLAPFKQVYSSTMLQGLARAMSFPITMFKVKGTEGMGPEMAFDHVNTVREEYDNIGVNASSAGGEVYTVNTKMWVPDDLIDIDVKESKCDIDFVGDIEMYQDKVAIASGVPKAYLDQEYGGFGNSGISLMEQYKPFARHVYAIQSCFLQGLGELIRLHFAITGEFDYNTPFILSMRFPAEEMSEDKRNARKDSMEMAQAVVDLIGKSLGLEEGEPLPEDVMIDILSKYSFLDPTDIQKWVRLSSYLKPTGAEDEDDGDGGDDFDFGGDDIGGDDLGGGDDMPESKRYTLKQAKRMLRERKQFINREHIKERRKSLRERYSEIKTDLYFHFLESQHLTEFTNNTRHTHALMVPPLTKNSLLSESIEVLTKPSEGLEKFKEADTIIATADMMNKLQEQTTNEDSSLASAIDQVKKEIFNG